MIGEIRDLETAQIAVQASLTGHLVLATLHTNDATSAVTRLADMGVEPYLLASSLLGRARAAPGAHAVPGLPHGAPRRPPAKPRCSPSSGCRASQRVCAAAAGCAHATRPAIAAAPASTSSCWSTMRSARLIHDGAPRARAARRRRSRTGWRRCARDGARWLAGGHDVARRARARHARSLTAAPRRMCRIPLRGRRRAAARRGTGCVDAETPRAGARPAARRRAHADGDRRAASARRRR